MKKWLHASTLGILLYLSTPSASADEKSVNPKIQEIQEKIAVYFRAPKLVDVMFTEFVIQL